MVGGQNVTNVYAAWQKFSFEMPITFDPYLLAQFWQQIQEEQARTM